MAGLPGLGITHARVVRWRNGCWKAVFIANKSLSVIKSTISVPVIWGITTNTTCQENIFDFIPVEVTKLSIEIPKNKQFIKCIRYFSRPLWVDVCYRCYPFLFLLNYLMGQRFALSKHSCNLLFVLFIQVKTPNRAVENYPVGPFVFRITAAFAISLIWRWLDLWCY